MAECGFDVQESFCRQCGRSGEDPSAYCQGLGCGPVSLHHHTTTYVEICLFTDTKIIAFISIRQSKHTHSCLFPGNPLTQWRRTFYWSRYLLILITKVVHLSIGQDKSVPKICNCAALSLHCSVRRLPPPLLLLILVLPPDISQQTINYPQ